VSICVFMPQKYKLYRSASWESEKENWEGKDVQNRSLFIL